MAPVQSQDSSPRAPQVCSHCKSIKKGCDKKLPSCSQCIKRRAVCRYGEHLEPRRYGDDIINACQNIGVNGPTSTWTAIPRSILGKLNPGIRLSILLMNSMSDVLYSDALGPNDAPSATSIDNIIHSQVCHLIRTDGNYIESVASKHFQGVHKWLPIISKKRFYDRLQYFQLHPTADFSMLLLTMHLMAQQPSSDFDVDQDREILYLATKTLFTQVQTFIPSSMCLVQAGVILASYERGHERIEAAYISIGTAARLACAIGIDTAQCSQELQGSDRWFDEEEALATWWGLTICDRNIACDNRMSGRPMAVRPIRDEDYLPLEPADLAGDIDYSMSPAFRYFVSAISLPTLGMFGREAQATHLVDKVKRAVDSMETNGQTFVTLGYELQTLLGKIIRQVAEQRTSYCGATQTLLV
ncbi:hypothetical protein LSUB1_G002748 [Lachnellula subtilissima]|uniref:Zn(2)-C6 fungal-type domain-containing protein n=1 Tax=Lachnellula subtilissima TaxID=602034 RepID=A0A8H8UDL4_9HELO|nr:hypothetical protein LSUB1_G002748 [Lachnellula subtilissima]